MMNVKRCRTNLHLSQDYVASVLGIDKASYNRIENGEQELSDEYIIKLNKLFGIPADEDEVFQHPFAATTIFEELDQHDQLEVMKLLKLRESLHC
jgi:transcriptional regulator with XRE-family HTH domain